MVTAVYPRFKRSRVSCFHQVKFSAMSKPTRLVAELNTVIYIFYFCWKFLKKLILRFCQNKTLSLHRATTILNFLLYYFWVNE